MIFKKPFPPMSCFFFHLNVGELNYLVYLQQFIVTQYIVFIAGCIIHSFTKWLPTLPSWSLDPRPQDRHIIIRSKETRTSKLVKKKKGYFEIVLRVIRGINRDTYQRGKGEGEARLGGQRRSL